MALVIFCFSFRPPASLCTALVIFSFSLRSLTSLARPSLSFRSLFGRLGALLGHFLPLLGALGALLAALGPLLGALGPLLAALGLLLGRSWALWGGSWGALGRSWPLLGRSWNDMQKSSKNQCQKLMILAPKRVPKGSQNRIPNRPKSKTKIDVKKNLCKIVLEPSWSDLGSFWRPSWEPKIV